MLQKKWDAVECEVDSLNSCMFGRGFFTDRVVAYSWYQRLGLVERKRRPKAYPTGGDAIVLIQHVPIRIEDYESIDLEDLDLD